MWTYVWGGARIKLPTKAGVCKLPLVCSNCCNHRGEMVGVMAIPPGNILQNAVRWCLRAKYITASQLASLTSQVSLVNIFNISINEQYYFVSQNIYIFLLCNFLITPNQHVQAMYVYNFIGIQYSKINIKKYIFFKYLSAGDKLTCSDIRTYKKLTWNSVGLRICFSFLVLVYKQLTFVLFYIYIYIKHYIFWENLKLCVWI